MTDELQRSWNIYSVRARSCFLGGKSKHFAQKWTYAAKLTQKSCLSLAHLLLTGSRWSGIRTTLAYYVFVNW